MISKGFNGFEMGANQVFSGSYATGPDRTRSGDFALNHHNLGGVNVANTVGVLSVGHLLSTLAEGESATGMMRVWIKLRIYPSTTGAMLAGFYPSFGTAWYAALLLNTSGQGAAAAYTTISAYSGSMALNTWYRVEVTAAYKNMTVGEDPPNGRNRLITTVAVYNEAGTLVMNPTATYYDPGAIAINPPNPAVGNATGVASDMGFVADDAMWIFGDRTDAVVALPDPAARIHRVRITGQGASAGWTGDYRNVIDVPMDRTSGLTTEQTVVTNGASTTFAHQTAAQAGLSGILGVQTVALVKAASGGADALLINGVEYAITTPTTYADATQLSALAVDYTPYSNAAFDAMEFGARNKRGISMQLGAIMLEVLHTGAGPVPVARSGSWKHKVVTYTGNGTWQDITSVGFPPDVVLIKKVAGSSNAGTFWTRHMGGTRSINMEVSAEAGQAAMGVLTNGFSVGPAASVNQSGISYVAICMADAGELESGAFMASGAYNGTGVDNRDIALGWQPGFVWVLPQAGFQYPYVRSDDFVGDSSMVLDANTPVANMIQGFSATGFQVGLGLNPGNTLHHWFALRQQTGQIDPFVEWGLFTPASLPHVQPVGLTADFVMVDRTSGGGGPYFRHATLHSGTNAASWATGAVNANAITALAAASFTVNATVTAAAQPTFYLLFSGTGTVPVATDAADFWADAAPFGGRPYPRTLVMIPSSGTNYARGRAVTLTAGTVLTNYPLANLTDDSMQTVARFAETAVTFSLDLGGVVPIDAVAILNHNFDPGLILQVFVSTDPAFPSASTQQIGVAAARPNMWVDLRTFVTTGRYIRIRTPLLTANSVPISIGEVVVGTLADLEGVVEPEMIRVKQYWAERQLTEELLSYRTLSGVISRGLEIGFSMDPTARAVLEAIFDDAGLTGYRVPFVPDSTKNDLYFLDWPASRDTEYVQSDRHTVLRLTVMEETPGVL